MCGIIGSMFHDPTHRVPVEQALRQLHHRGPDDHGTFFDTHVVLGHTRLSILDLSPLGRQPMSYQDGRFWITFNGEIYNYLELRQELAAAGYSFISQSDTEVLVAAYARWGKACVKKLRGMFAFGIWDRKEQHLFLARDRVGEKPFYYWYGEQNFYFASELKALLLLLPHTPELDPAAIDLYLHYQYVPEPRTPLKGVYKLPAAHFLFMNVASGPPRPEQYWSLEDAEPVEGDPVSLIRQELEQSIELTLRSDVPVGLALSGGIDSGAIAALAAPKYKDTLHAFSVGYPGRPAYDERKQAEQLAQKLKLPFHDIELRTEEFVDFFPELVMLTDDPIADIAVYGHYAVMKLAAEHGVKVMLAGIGGDELFWGYTWVVEAVRLTRQKQHKLQNSLHTRWVWRIWEQLTNTPLYQRFAHSYKMPKFMSSFFKQGFELGKIIPHSPQQAVFYDLLPDFIHALHYSKNFYTRGFSDQLSNRNPFRPFELQLNGLRNIPLHICQLLFNTWLTSNSLALGDRVSMASSVETRFPLLDYQLIELVIGLHQSYPDHISGHKTWFKSAVEYLLPEETLLRPKLGFQPPVHEWMTTIIERYFDWLMDGYLAQLKVVDVDYLQKIRHDFEKRWRIIFLLYKLVLLEVWYRQVVLQESVCV